MKLPHLNKREQVLLALTICVIFVGAYVWFRYIPANRRIGELRLAAEATETRMRTTTIPEEPEDDTERLNAQVIEQEQLLVSVKTQAEAIERRLAPSDSQLLIVDISQVARDAQVYVRINEAYKAAANTNGAPAQAGKKTRQNKAATAAPVAASEAAVLPASAGWIARMATGSAFERPLRRLEVEGSYLALNRFIHDLDALPFHVAVLRVSIEKMPVLVMPGYPQALLAELILAL